jgi:hypothetical protein
VRPKELTTGTALVYALPSGEGDLRRIVDLWIRTRQASGEADEAYDYWIRGQALRPQAPRWSVLGDVIGWH